MQLSATLSVETLLEKAVNQLYDDRKIDDATRRQLAQSHYEPLKQAVNEGYSQVQKKFEYGTPNYEFLKQLQTNTAVFAVFKNHAAMKEMAALLKDAGGNLRSREDFKREALKVDATYRGSKLDAEYDTAVRQTRMAANWQKYVAKQKLYPNLKYIRTKAAKPDEKHLEYVGIIRPVNDAFWNVHYPPNRWLCQCSVEQTDEEPTDIPSGLPPVDPAFAFNSGKAGQVFDIEASSYIKSVPAKEQPALIKEAKALVQKDTAADTAYQPLYKSKAGHEVAVHPLAFDNGDFNEVAKAAKELANLKNGPKNIEILPDISDAKLREKLLPGAKQLKNPDYRIDGEYADLKTIKAGRSKNTIKHAMDEARAQANSMVLHIGDDYPFTEEEVIAAVRKKAAFEEMKGFGDIWLNYKGTWTKNPHKKRAE